MCSFTICVKWVCNLLFKLSLSKRLLELRTIASVYNPTKNTMQRTNNNTISHLNVSCLLNKQNTLDEFICFITATNFACR